MLTALDTLHLPDPSHTHGAFAEVQAPAPRPSHRCHRFLSLPLPSFPSLADTLPQRRDEDYPRPSSRTALALTLDPDPGSAEPRSALALITYRFLGTSPSAVARSCAHPPSPSTRIVLVVAAPSGYRSLARSPSSSSLLLPSHHHQHHRRSH